MLSVIFHFSSVIKLFLIIKFLTDNLFILRYAPLVRFNPVEFRWEFDDGNVATLQIENKLGKRDISENSLNSMNFPSKGQSFSDISTFPQFFSQTLQTAVQLPCWFRKQFIHKFRECSSIHLFSSCSEVHHTSRRYFPSKFENACQSSEHCYTAKTTNSRQHTGYVVSFDNIKYCCNRIKDNDGKHSNSVCVHILQWTDNDRTSDSVYTIYGYVFRSCGVTCSFIIFLFSCQYTVNIFEIQSAWYKRLSMGKNKSVWRKSL